MEKKRPPENAPAATPIWKLTQLDLFTSRSVSPAGAQEPGALPGANYMEQAYCEIKEKIQTCFYMPGSSLNEKQLNQEFPYGRTPIREALLFLRRDRLIEVFPRRGMRIAPITAKDISDVFAFRRLLERTVLAENPAQFPKDMLVRFGQELQRVSEDPQAVFRLDREFHLCLFTQPHNELLQESYGSLLEKSFRAFVYLARLGVSAAGLVQERDETLIQAILVEDGAAVKRIIDEYGNRLLIELLRGLPEEA